MPKVKLKIHSPDGMPHTCEVSIDGKVIDCVAISLNVAVEKPSTATLTVYIDEIEIDLDRIDDDSHRIFRRTLKGELNLAERAALPTDEKEH